MTPKFCLSKKPRTTANVLILEDNSSISGVSGICLEEDDSEESDSESNSELLVKRK